MHLAVPPQSHFAWAVPAGCMAMLGVPLYLYIPKLYSDVGLVDVGLIGMAVLAARILDGVVDPLIGRASDGLRTRWGRRRPFLLFVAPLLAINFVALYAPPGLGDPGQSEMLGVWFAVFLLSLTLCFSLVNVPLESLGPEITKHRHERTRLYGLKDGLVLLGTLVAAAGPEVLQRLGLSEPEAFRAFAIGGGAVLWAACWWCVRACPEPPPKEDARTPFWPAFKSVWQNKPFRILMVATLIASIGANLPATLIVFYVEHVLQSELAPLFLLAYLLTGVACLPLWVLLARRIGRKRAWLLAMGVNAGAFLGVFFLGQGDVLWYGVLVIASGTGFGASLSLPAAMQADVIDYDALQTGERREGLYLGVWSVLRTLASSAGMGVALPILDAAGYIPGASEQPQAVVLSLRILYALVPSVLTLAALFVARKYPSRLLETATA